MATFVPPSSPDPEPTRPADPTTLPQAAGIARRAMQDDAGTIVHGRYRLIARLGTGGMGVTYRAWDAEAGIPVVVKMPRRDVRQDKQIMARFAREVAALRAVTHQAIVPITDSGEDDGCPFVVMRFLPGGALSDYRRRDESGRPLRNPIGMLHTWLPGIAAALDHIHSSGILHRDVKPGNVFLDGFLRPFLGDFGIAKVLEESTVLAVVETLTATKMAVGTPEYMAPELFRSRAQVDGRADQYALAVTVYEMVAMEKPFTGRTAHVIVEHTTMPVPPLGDRCPGLPQSLCDAVHRALSKNPADRFETCGGFAAAVLAAVPPLEPEPDTVRLLCPNCKNILKLRGNAAGKQGKCPRCQMAMDVSSDMGSLWLEGEDRGTAVTVIGSSPSSMRPLVDAKTIQPPRPDTRHFRHWSLAVATLVAGLLLGIVSNAAWHRNTVRQANPTLLPENLTRLRRELDEARRDVTEKDETVKRLKLDGEALVAEQRRLEQALAVAIEDARKPPAAPEPLPDPGHLLQPGTTFEFRVVGTPRRDVVCIWGVNPYTADSHLATAAVHAGVLKPGETGVVRVTLLPGQEGFPGSQQNGVTSGFWARFPLAYRIEPTSPTGSGRQVEVE